MPLLSTRDAVVDPAPLAKGFHIVTGPMPYNADQPSLKDWNTVYKLLIDNGFSNKPVLEGAGRCGGRSVCLGDRQCRQSLVHLRGESADRIAR